MDDGRQYCKLLAFLKPLHWRLTVNKRCFIVSAHLSLSQRWNTLTSLQWIHAWTCMCGTETASWPDIRQHQTEDNIAAAFHVLSEMLKCVSSGHLCLQPKCKCLKKKKKKEACGCARANLELARQQTIRLALDKSSTFMKSWKQTVWKKTTLFL